MLDSLRAFAKTLIAKIFFAVLIVSFAAFGISNVITNLGSDTVAKVGNQDISSVDFQRAYQQQINAAAQQMGKVPTGDEAVAMGLPGQTLSRLSSDAALDQMAEQFGLGVSDDKMGELLRTDPAFAGTLGNFSRDTFVQILQQNGFTEADYLKNSAEAAKRAQLSVALFSDVEPSDTATQLINRYTGDRRSVDYFVLNSTSIPPVAEPTDADLAAYLKDKQANYRTEETRGVDILTLSPEVLAAGKTFPDDQLQAEYDRTKASLTKAEKRTIEQVVLPDANAVKIFQDGKAAGTKFDDLVKQAGLTSTSLGTLAKTDVTDPTLANAAFGLQQGDFAVIPGAVGQRAVAVTEIQPGGTISFDDAKAAVQQNLALAQAKNEYADVLDQIEELRAAFKPLSEIADRFKLKLTHVELTPSGDALSAIPDIATTDRTKVEQAIFAAQPDKLAPTISLTSNHNVWFDLGKIDPARDQTLDEVHDAVAAAWTQAKTDEALTAAANTIKGQLTSGTPLADIAASMNQFPQLSQPISREGDGTPVFSGSVAQEVFNGGADHSGAVQDQDGDFVVFKVNSVTQAGDPSPQLKTALQGATRDTLYAEFVGGITQQAGMHINQQALSQLLDMSGAGQ